MGDIMINSSLSLTEKRDLYMAAYREQKNEIDKRIAEGIEKYRKGDCVLTLKDKNGKPLKNAKVKIKQKCHDFKYGANIFMLDEFKEAKDNAEYRRFFKEYFNLATVPFYWNAIEPEKDVLRYDKNSVKRYRRPAPDLCVEYCEENGIMPKLHCLFYDKAAPEWTYNLPLSELEELFEKRVKQIAERYKGKMYEFEVVNELSCVHDKKTELFFKDDLVPWTFSVADKYLKGETLVINETTPVCQMAYMKVRHPYYLLIDGALAKGAKIDKIGIQNHLFTGVSSHNQAQYDASLKSGVSMAKPLDYLDGLDVLAKFGLPIEITEITVPTFGESEEDEQLQADLLALWYATFFSHPAVDGLVYWNTVDGHAYTGNPNWIENNCQGGLFHKDLTPKKSALMMKKLFNEIWHTDLELLTNENGEVNFRGFYGDYSCELDGQKIEFSIHKNQENKFLF